MRELLLFLICMMSINIICHSQINYEERKNLLWDTLEYPKNEYGWNEGMTVPDILIEDVNGVERKLYDILSDKPIIVDFWFVACKPCIANKKYLKRFYHQYPVEILSISVDKDESTVKTYVDKNEIYWINVHDDSSYHERFKLQIGSNQSYPLYILINQERKVLGVYKSGEGIYSLGVKLQELFN